MAHLFQVDENLQHQLAFLSNYNCFFVDFTPPKSLHFLHPLQSQWVDWLRGLNLLCFCRLEVSKINLVFWVKNQLFLQFRLFLFYLFHQTCCKVKHLWLCFLSLLLRCLDSMCFLKTICLTLNRLGRNCLLPVIIFHDLVELALKHLWAPPPFVCHCCSFFFELKDFIFEINVLCSISEGSKCTNQTNIWVLLWGLLSWYSINLFWVHTSIGPQLSPLNYPFPLCFPQSSALRWYVRYLQLYLLTTSSYFSRSFRTLQLQNPFLFVHLQAWNLQELECLHSHLSWGLSGSLIEQGHIALQRYQCTEAQGFLPADTRERWGTCLCCIWSKDRTSCFWAPVRFRRVQHWFQLQKSRR